MNTAESTEDNTGDLVTDTHAIEFHLYPLDDTAGGNFNGWTTSATYDITIKIPSGARGSNFGKWDGTIFNEKRSNNTGLFLIEDYITVDGFQVELNGNGSDHGIMAYGQNASNQIIINDVVVVEATANTSTGDEGIRVNDSDTNLIVSNAIIYGFDDTGDSGIQVEAATSAVFYNVTVSDCYNNINVGTNDPGTFYNTVTNGAGNDNWVICNACTGDYNASDDNDANLPDDSGTSVDSFTDTTEFEDPNASVAYDFRLKSTATALLDAGNSGYSYGDPSIDGHTRGSYGTSWDIGASECDDCGAEPAARRIFLIH